MKFLKKIIKNFLLKKRHRKFRKQKIKNNDVTIFSNCCIGGTMYNDLGLQFLSPTVNLFFGHHGFIDWVNHYEEYKDAELIDTGDFDINEHNKKAPICLLRKAGLPDIEIHFLHYNSYEEAKEKWYSRYERINPKKIFLVIEAQAEHEHQLLDEYVSLPYPKIIFSNVKSELHRDILHMSVYDSNPEKSVTGLIGYAGKRGYDEYDFVNEIFNREYN